MQPKTAKPPASAVGSFTEASTLPKLLTGKELRALIPYSEQHIRRLEKKGEFPRSVHLGPGRVVWVEAEILDWLESRRSGNAR